MKYRLNRAVASTGFCSRRKADEYIQAGRVSVNGRVIVDFNFDVDPDRDHLEIDGKNLSVKYFDYVLLYKPLGVVTTCKDEYARRNVLDLLPDDLQHVKPVGRLDRDSEGLILLTNDGALAQRLAHPSHTVYKVYEVTVQGKITDTALNSLAKGVRLDDGVTLPAKVKLLDRADHQTIFEMSIREGRNRQIRRMCAKIGYPVLHLLRVGMGRLQLGLLQPGNWRHLTAEELQALRSD